MSLSRLHVIAVVTMELTMDAPRPESFKPWYDAMSSLSSFKPLYRPAFSAGGVRYEMVFAYDLRLAIVASEGLFAA